jgi:hypothetical protein
MQATLTPAIKQKLKNLVEIQTYFAEAQKQIPELQDELACSLFPDHDREFQSLKFGDLTITCERKSDVSLLNGALDSMSHAQRDWLIKENILVGGNQINKFHYDALTPELKSTLGAFLLINKHPATITVTGSTK